MAHSHQELRLDGEKRSSTMDALVPFDADSLQKRRRGKLHWEGGKEGRREGGKEGW